MKSITVMLAINRVIIMLKNVCKLNATDSMEIYHHKLLEQFGVFFRKCKYKFVKNVIRFAININLMNY